MFTKLMIVSWFEGLVCKLSISFTT